MEDQAHSLSPRNNPDLFGQAEAERRLLDAAACGRLHHAWLITGPRGIGKATLAFRFARYLFKYGRDLPRAPADSLRVDADDPVFRRTAAAGHADLLVIERATDERSGKRRREITVGDTRALGGFLHLSAAEEGWRIAIIDSADEMNRNAANAVLKLLEEPPSKTLILMVCHSPGRLLRTIRSRCTKLSLKPLEQAALDQVVARWAPDMPEEDRATIAALADGSAGRAAALIEQDGLTHYRALVALLETLPGLDIAAAHRFCDALARPTAEDAYVLIADLLRWGLGRRAVDGARGQAGAAIALADWDRVDDLLTQGVRANLDRKQAMLSALLTLDGSPASLS